MKKITICLATVILVLAGSHAVFSSEDEHEQVHSLRGTVPIDAVSAQPKTLEQNMDKGTIKRSFPLNPPMIPHAIEDYEITLSSNPCLSCHEDPASGAKVISESHHLDRDAKRHKGSAARRYFCTQCHAPQAKADPLVENKYKP